MESDDDEGKEDLLLLFLLFLVVAVQKKVDNMMMIAVSLYGVTSNSKNILLPFAINAIDNEAIREPDCLNKAR